MRKYLYKIEFKKILGILMFTVVFINSSVVYSQSTIQSEKAATYDILVPYNVPFNFKLESNATWELKNAEGQLIHSGKGSLENNVFSIPGDYVLHIQTVFDPNLCDSDQSPKKINIKASAMKMVFDFESVTFSKKIVGGQATDGITVRVNVDYSSLENNSAIYTYGFVTAGVDTTVVGKLKNGQVTLQQGMNTLEFELEGQATAGNYIMFDFVDVNGEVQSYGLTQKIE